MKKIYILLIFTILLTSNVISHGEKNMFLISKPTFLTESTNDLHWEKMFSEDFRLTTHMDNEGSWDPDVAFADDKYFITWEEGIFKSYLSPLYKIQIRGCFLSRNGELIGDSFDITQWDDSQTSSFRCEDPAVVYGETSSTKSFFIAYEYYTDSTNSFSRDIKGAIVPIDAISIDDVTHFDICVLKNNQDDPVVCFDRVNECFFVVWADSREGGDDYNIYGKFFDVYGNQLGEEILVTDSIKNQCEPSVAFDDKNQRFMVVWENAEHPEYGPFEIWGKLLNSDGTPKTNEQRFSQISSENVDYNYPHVVFCNDRYLIEWHQDDISVGIELGTVYGLIIDKDGNPKGEIFEIIDGKYQVNEICSFENSLFFVSFDDRKDIWGKFVSLDGFTQSVTKKISDDSSYPTDWSSINFVDNNLIALWEDTRIEYTKYNEEKTDIFLNIWSFSNQPPFTLDESIETLAGLVHHSIDIQAKGNDTENDKIQLYYDWGDGTGDWTDFVESNREVTASHIWRQKGVYHIKYKLRDEYFSESDWSEEFMIIISDDANNPPNSPNLNYGQTEIKRNSTHIYSSSASDPDGDKIQLWFDWGDGSSTGWSEFIFSGDIVSRDHCWRKVGTYEIKVRAKDESGSVSYWSDPYIVECKEQKSPPINLTFDGPDNARVNNKITFNLISIDPNGDDIFYWINWGDCDQNCISVYGPYQSGTRVSITKTWSQKGEYEIKYQAKDYYNYKSAEYTHVIKISYLTNYFGLSKLIKDIIFHY